MTEDHDFKRLVRARMEKTGETYSTARANTLRQRSKEETGPFDDIRITSVAAAHVATIRTGPIRLRSWTDNWTDAVRESVPPLFRELNRLLTEEQKVRVARPLIFYERGQGSTVYAFAARVIDRSITELTAPIEIRDLPPIEQAATLTRTGEPGVVWDSMVRDLREWARRMGYRLVGFGRDQIEAMSNDGQLRKGTLSWEITEQTLPKGPSSGRVYPPNFSPNAAGAMLAMYARTFHGDESFFMTSLKVRKRRHFEQGRVEVMIVEYHTPTRPVQNVVVAERSDDGNWSARIVGGGGLNEHPEQEGRLWVNLVLQWNDLNVIGGGRIEGPRRDEVAKARFTFSDGEEIEEDTDEGFALFYRRPGLEPPLDVNLLSRNGDVLSSYSEPLPFR